MSYTLTPNLGLKLIDYNTEDDSWGSLQADNSNVLDAQVGNKHAFMIDKNGVNQSMPTSIATLVTFANKVFDSNSNFANNRFTPSEVGFYFLYAQIRMNNISPSGLFYMTFSRDGIIIYTSVTMSPAAVDIYSMCSLSSVVQVSSVGPYFEVFVTQTDTVARNIDGAAQYTFFTGFKI